MDENMQLITDCVARESRLTDWDRNFLDSIQFQLEEGRSLTGRQVGVLHKIWERVTEKG